MCYGENKQYLCWELTEDMLDESFDKDALEEHIAKLIAEQDGRWSKQGLHRPAKTSVVERQLVSNTTSSALLINGYVICYITLDIPLH